MSFSPRRSNHASRPVHRQQVLRPTLPEQEGWTPTAQPELMSQWSHRCRAGRTFTSHVIQWVLDLDGQQSRCLRDPGWSATILPRKPQESPSLHGGVTTPAQREHRAERMRSAKGARPGRTPRPDSLSPGTHWARLITDGEGAVH